MERFKEQLVAAIACTAVISLASLPASAQLTGSATTTVHHHYVHKKGTLHGYMAEHPKVRAAAMGAGIGTAAGAVTGLVTHKGIVRGAVIGAGTGAGVGLVRSSNTLKRHPIARDVATGSLVGLGLGAASHRHGHWAAKGTAVGAAVGLGTGLLTHGL